jgi:hypothetical protein
MAQASAEGPGVVVSAASLMGGPCLSDRSELNRLFEVRFRVRDGRVGCREGLVVHQVGFGHVDEGAGEEVACLVEVAAGGDDAGEIEDLGVDAAVDELVHGSVGHRGDFSRSAGGAWREKKKLRVCI